MVSSNRRGLTACYLLRGQLHPCGHEQHDPENWEDEDHHIHKPVGEYSCNATLEPPCVKNDVDRMGVRPRPLKSPGQKNAVENHPKKDTDPAEVRVQGSEHSRG